MSDESLKPLVEIAAAVAVVGLAAELLSEAKTPATAPPAGRRSGYKLMAARPGALRYQATDEIAAAQLPNKVDLRPLMTPIEDQGETSSCVAHAVAGAYQYWIKKASHQEKDVSRLFIYYNARWRDGSQGEDGGSVIQLAMEGLSTFGACDETMWPFDPQFLLERPDDDCYKDAATYRVHDMAQVPTDLQAWKQALAEGKPIVFGCELFDSFDNCTDNGGVVTMPDPNEIARAKHSGHSMCAVGYSDSENVFIVRNSWGTDWGDKGYCYIPYAYLMSDKFNDGDCWVFVPKVPIDPPREVWSDTTEPVTNGGKGVDFPIQPFTIADYAEIAVDFFNDVRHPFNPTLIATYEKFASAVGNGLWEQLKSEL
jgi:hypothetical protein